MPKPGERFHFAANVSTFGFIFLQLIWTMSRVLSSKSAKLQPDVKRVHLTFLCVSLNFLPLAFILLNFGKGEETAKFSLLGLGVKHEQSKASSLFWAGLHFSSFPVSLPSLPLRKPAECGAPSWPRGGLAASVDGQEHLG